ncbi:MAG TPA: hypothetical protein VHG51_19375 [Longimicrobiaceae bacterium]|nr:hypothetical protein [Longimicrobiaceae bacterium]
MRHTSLNLAAAACMALLLTACEASTVLEPESARAALCSWDGECGPGDGRDPPTDTTAIPPVEAEYRYWSTAGTGTSYVGDTWLKWVYLRSYSESIRYVSSMRVDMTIRQGPTCNPAGTQILATRYATGNGSPLKIKASYDTFYNGGYVKTTYVDAVHSFTAVQGGVGGGTFPSSAFVCY